jgi:hypothetical protein
MILDKEGAKSIHMMRGSNIIKYKLTSILVVA